MNETVWAFDLGKASIGEAVRQGNKFLHKASLLIPADLGRRGPATMSGTPASRYRMLQTRLAHARREEWLDRVWMAAGLTPLVSRTVEHVDFTVRRVKKNVRGKVRWRNKKVGGRWILKSKADPSLEREFGGADDSECYTSCLLRIKLLNGDTLKDWQLYKALFSAIQKRGYADVPWKVQRKATEDKPKNAQEEAENAIAGKRWTDFSKHPDVAKIGTHFQRACYFDAWHMKLWNPAKPKEISLHPTERQESTQKVVFPGRIIAEEVLALARKATEQEKRLETGFSKVMEDWKKSVKERIARINAHRAHLGKSLVWVPDFSRGANNFAELLVYGPGGAPENPIDGVRHIASHDPDIRRATGLHPGGADDTMGALNQKVARFENRLRASCALIPRLVVCGNLAPEESVRIKEHDHERLLPSQVTLLMKLKNMSVEERNAARNQRGLKSEELRKIFEALNPKRKYHLTKREWRDWCRHFEVLPVTDPDDKDGAKNNQAPAEGTEKKKTDDLAVEKPKPAGRSRFSRPALLILKELLLSGLSPRVFHDDLANARTVLKVKTGPRSGPIIEKTLNVAADTGDAKTDTKNRMCGLLVSDLQFLLRMGKDGKPADSWDDLYIPSQQLDRRAQEAQATMEERASAIRALIGEQNNPIVRHRLDAFWKRLQKLEKAYDIPQRIVLEFVRDDSETSWLGTEAAAEITRAQKEQRERRERARKMLAEMGNPNGDVLKYLLWEAQGGQCLYGKPAGKPQCPYTETGLSFTDLHKYRIDHIVPRAKGGPDSFSNYVLTTDETNAAKGDRTPWQWFREDRNQQDWDAYKSRVWTRVNQLGWKKVRLLLSADAEKLVERYTPLAETAWIARLAQTVAGLHFGWVNGNDREGNKRVITVSGGLTGRVRRQYFLNSLLGRDRELDGKISERLDSLAELRSSGLPWKEQRDKARALRSELDELGAQANKDRADKRHHALDAMVLSFLEGWVNDPKREEEFRLELLGDNPTFPPNLMGEIGKLRSQIIAMEATVAKSGSAEERARLNERIISCRDGLAKMRMERNIRAVRAAFRREIEGDEKGGVKPILPFALHYPKPHLEATFHRGVWLKVESASRAVHATIDDYDKAFEQERVPLLELPNQENFVTEEKEHSVAYAVLRIAEIAPHKDYDAMSVRKAVESFLKTNPSIEEWQAWCTCDVAPAGIKPKKGQPNKREIVLYRIEEKRTKRVSLFGLGVGSSEVPEYDRAHFEMQINRLVCRPERSKDKPETPLQPDGELQAKLRELQPRIEAFYQENPPDPGDRPRKESARAEWQARKDRAKEAWEQFQKDTGLDRHKRVCLRTDSAKTTDRRYELAGLSSLLLVRVKRYDHENAEKQIQFLSDAWTRFQLREFLKQNPSPKQWKEFCGTFVQVRREELKQFLSPQPQTAEEFIRFYQQQAEASARRDGAANKIRSIVKTVQKVIGNPHAFVDVSKDGSGIYATSGNRGYFVWRRRTTDGENAEQFVYGTQPVQAFLRLADVKRQLLRQEGMELLDKRLWQTDMLLHLPNDTLSGKKTVPSGYYLFGSISNGTNATLKPMAGGDVYDGIRIDLLLEKGLSRVHLETETKEKTQV